MNPPKNTEFLHGEPFSSPSGVGHASPKDEEYQLIFLLDRPLPGRSPIPAQVAEHILHLPPADNLDPRT